MAWETKRVEQLLSLNKQGFSASQIAEKLGAGVTRNAVIGKLNRMGLSCGGGKVAVAQPAAKRAKPSFGKGLSLAKTSKEKEAPVLCPAEEHVGVGDLSDSICRFPMGDPDDSDYRHCGAKREQWEEGVYCEYHRQLTHQRSKRMLAKAEREEVKTIHKAAG